jgi:hypothetical protein
MAVIKHLADLDLNQNQILNAVVENSLNAPSSPVEGQIYWSTSDDTLYVYSSDITDWIDLGASGVTNLSYTAAVSQGTVTSNTGTNATIPLAGSTNAGLMTAAEKTKVGNTSGTNSGDNATNSQYSGLQTNVSTNLSEGSSTNTTVNVNSSDGSNATLASASTSRAGVMSKAKFDEVEANTDAIANLDTNVSTNLSEGSTTTTTVKVDSSDGTDATLQQASSTRAGLLSSAKFDEIVANSLKTSDINHNVSTNLSEGSTTTTTVKVNSSDGADATLEQASSTRAGVLSSAKFDEIVANSLKTSDINHNVSTDLSISKSSTVNVITSSDGNNATITAANTTNAGLMTKAIFDEHTANNAKVTDVNHNVSTNLGISKNSTTNIITSSDGNNTTITAANTTNAGLMTKAIFDEHVVNNAKVSNVDETLTTLELSANILKYTDEDGVETDLNLALYLDDSNLARLSGGTLNASTGIGTFDRDDGSKFTIDMSAFLDAITLNNTLTSTSTTEGLTANMGKELKDLIDALVTSTGSNTGDEVQATTTVAGISEIATQTEVNSGSDDERIVTPLTLKNTLGITASLSTTLTYSALIGNGSSTSIAVTHSIGNRFVQASVYENTTAGDFVECEIELTSASVTTFKFNVAPTSNALRVVITG